MDESCPPSHQEATRDYYNHFGAKVELVMQNIGHTMPSLYHTVPDYPTDYDTVGAMMTHLLTNLKVNAVQSVAPGDTDWASKGVLKPFF